jgi:tetratricopeptide (TPR) repeat protein
MTRRITKPRQRRSDQPAGSRRSPYFRWAVLAALALAGAIGVLAIRGWKSEPELESLPDVALASAEPDVVRLVDQARGLVARDPRSAIAWGDLGAVLWAHDFGPEAEQCFRNAQRLDPSDYRWPYLLGMSRCTTDADQALLHYRRAADLAPDRAHVQLRLAESLLAANLLDDAEPVIARALAIAPDNPRAQLAKAQMLFAQGNLEDSRTWCERSAEGAAGKRAPYLLLAQLSRRLNDSAAAARAAAALDAIPDKTTEWEDPDVAKVLALRRDQASQLIAVDQLVAAGRVQEATDRLIDLSRTADLSGTMTEKLVGFLLKQGRPDEAEAVLREKLAQSPNHERLRFQLGVVLFGSQKYAAAAAEFERACELKPDNIEALCNLGHSLRLSGRQDDAQGAFAAAVRLSPGNAFGRTNLAELLLDAGKIDEARPHVEVAARLAPRDPQVLALVKRLPAAP